MVIKNTILSKKDASLLEEIIVQYGRIVDIDKLYKIFGKTYSAQETRNRISFLSRAGWFFRLKKGLYIVVTDLGELNAFNLSLYSLAQVLNKNSYISFENALQYHGMFDQMLDSVAAVTFKRARKYKVKNTEVKFHHIKKELYFGFTQEKAEVGMVNIAEKEKALLDILYFSSDTFHFSMVWEKLSENRKIINFSKLIQYALHFNIKVLRQTGFFLDMLHIDTKILFEQVKGNTSYSKMSSSAREFNSKWRFYFDSTAIK